MATHKNNTVTKAFQVLEAFESQHSAMTARELSEHLRMNLATTHRFLLTLESLGALARPDGNKFQLGMLLADLGGRVATHEVIAGILRPHLLAMVKIARETVHAGAFDKGNVLYIAKRESERSLKIDTYIGKRLPAYCTAMGRLLLSGLQEAELDAYFENVELKALTSKTIVDVGDIRKAIAKAARDGFAMDNEETEEGLRCVAAPIRDGSGRICAAMSVSAPTTRLRASALEEIRAALIENAMEASAKINPLARDAKRTSKAGSGLDGTEP